jgi:DNA-binding transcriptional ArsR family regulator
MYYSGMPRASTTSDAFNAIAEPRRRAILELLCETDLTVNDMVEILGFDQPSVSKHLRVLRRVELVRVRSRGRHRIYSASPKGLEPVAAWIKRIEQFWDHHLSQIQVAAERRAKAKGDKK